MKKIGIIVIALVAIIGIYYLTVGSAQIVEKMKQELNSELTELQKVGFDIKDREVTEKKEHFVIAFDDSKKITDYLKEEDIAIAQNDIEILKGGEFGVDIEYLPTARDAISMEIYPTKLPSSFYAELVGEDKKAVQELEKMIKDKLFLVHVNINKLSNAFDGYLKDIDKNGFISRGFKFEGKIDDEKIKSATQSLELISYSLEKELDMNISSLTTNILNMDRDSIDMDYSIESIGFKSEDNQSSLFIANGLYGLFSSEIKSGLLSETNDFNISSIKLVREGEDTLIKNFKLNTNINNINEEALSRLQNFSSDGLDENETMKHLIPILKDITTADSSINISNISIESIITNGQKIEGFNIDAFGKVNGDFDWKEVEDNPMALLNLFDTKINLEASNDIVSMVASDPRAMMLMMFIQPIDKNGKKVFNIEFSKGSLKVNGKPMM